MGMQIRKLLGLCHNGMLAVDADPEAGRSGEHHQAEQWDNNMECDGTGRGPIDMEHESMLVQPVNGATKLPKER